MVTSIATASDTTIVITFSENVVDTSANLDLSQFSFVKTLDGSPTTETPSSPVFTSTTLTLTVNSIGSDNNVLTLSYTDVSGADNTIVSDTAGTPNKLADFATTSVTNNLDTTAPIVTSIATASDTTIVITFSENVDDTSANLDLSQFSFVKTLDGSPTTETPSSPVFTSTTLTLTVNSIGSDNNVLTLSYTDASGADNTIVSDTAGTPNKLADFATTSVTNNLDTTAPIVTSIATASDTTIVITFSENVVDTSANLDLSQFSFVKTLDGSPTTETPSSPVFTSTILTLTVNSIGSDNNVLTLSYTDVSGADNTIVSDTAGTPNKLADFATTSVTNNLDTTAPTVTSIATASDTTIVITFDENIQASDISNALSQFIFVAGYNEEHICYCN